MKLLFLLFSFWLEQEFLQYLPWQLRWVMLAKPVEAVELLQVEGQQAEVL